MVLHRSPDSPVPLQGQSHSDVDGTAENKVVQGIETIAKGIFMKLEMDKYNFVSPPASEASR